MTLGALAPQHSHVANVDPSPSSMLIWDMVGRDVMSIDA
jgi:hypothetical protein